MFLLKSKLTKLSESHCIRSPKEPTPAKKPIVLDSDEDDGSTCPICLDSWEMSGTHRLISLKCGHLFGQSCIKR